MNRNPKKEVDYGSLIFLDKIKEKYKTTAKTALKPGNVTFNSLHIFQPSYLALAFCCLNYSSFLPVQMFFSPYFLFKTKTKCNFQWGKKCTEKLYFISGKNHR